MKRFNLLIAAALALLLGLGFSFPQEKSKDNKEVSVGKSMDLQKVVYSCPMHPEIILDKPGKCPKCGMDLEKKQSRESESDDAASMCARMCDMMMKSPSMMNMMHEQMMEGMKESAPDSTHSGSMQKDMMKSCCRVMMQKTE